MVREVGENSLFIHIPKTAGKSVTKSLGLEHQSSDHSVKNLPEDWESRFRFCFVRDPVDRLLSALNYHLRLGLMMVKRQDQEQEQILPRNQRNEWVEQFRLFLSREEPSLDEVIKYLVDTGGFKRSVHLRQQMFWIRKCKPQFIGRVETITQDWAYLTSLLSQDQEVNLFSNLMHVNISEKIYDRTAFSECSAVAIKAFKAQYKDDLVFIGSSFKQL